MSLEISSPGNRRIKELAHFAKRRVRDDRRMTVVEGVRETGRALACGVVPAEAYICEELIEGPEAAAIIAQLRQLDAERKIWLYELSREAFARAAYREESGGLLLVVPYLTRPLERLPLSANPFLVIIEGAEKPGNLGAILRTADGAGADGVIICAAAGQTGTDVHNPNAIRASLGTIFHVPVAEVSTQDALQFLQQRGIQRIATTPDATEIYTNVDMRGPVALVMGSEAEGLSDAWLDAAEVRVQIPMRGIADSLNLSTAAALLLYEAVRQRQA